MSGRHPKVVAHTTCPNGHQGDVEAIDPVAVDGELIDCVWPSAFDFCADCDAPNVSADVEVWA